MSRVQSIERAFAVLGALADGPIGVTEVADRADLPKSTAARLLASLAREGVVEQVPGDTRYRLGPRLVTLAARIRPARTLAALARPSLEELAEAAGEAAGLSVRDGDFTHYIEQVGSPNPVSVRDWTGSRIPLHAVSSGQVLLAFAPPTFVQRYLGRPMEPFTRADAGRPPTRCSSGCARSGATATRGRSRSSTRASRRSRRRSPMRRARSSPRSISTGRRTASRRPGSRTALADAWSLPRPPDLGEPAPGRLSAGRASRLPGRCSSTRVWVSNWARPSTNQTASTGTSPIVARRCGIDELIEIASPGSRMYSSNPMRTWRRPLST